MKIQPTPVKAFVYTNLWKIVSVVVIVAMGVAYLQADVIANAQAIIRNGSDIEDLGEIIDELPSKEWFILKFENIDDRFDDLENK